MVDIKSGVQPGGIKGVKERTILQLLYKEKYYRTSDGAERSKHGLQSL